MRGQSFWRGAVWCALVALLAAAPAFAQLQTGNLYGTVVDEQGAPLPGVTVTLSGGGAPQVQVTDAQGQFRFLGLAPGSTGSKAELEGFSTVDYPNIAINIGRNTEIEVTLQRRGRGRHHGHRRDPAARRAPDLAPAPRSTRPSSRRSRPPATPGRSCRPLPACSPTASTSAATRAASSRSTSAPAPTATRRSGRSTAWSSPTWRRSAPRPATTTSTRSRRCRSRPAAPTPPSPPAAWCSTW